MKQELRDHTLAYILLVSGLGVLMLVFLAVWPDRLLQRLVIGLLCLFYFSWGALTHIHTLTITRQVIYEYASMTLLAGTLLMLITF